MKKRALQLVLGTALVSVFGVSVLVGKLSASNQSYAITEPYAYPVKPGTQTWIDMTPRERRASCYVGEELAKQMTTQALIGTVLDYPYWVDVFAFDSFELGIRSVSSSFPPLSELLSREDAEKTLEQYTEGRSAYGEDGKVDLKTHGAQSLLLFIQQDAGGTTQLE